MGTKTSRRRSPSSCSAGSAKEMPDGSRLRGDIHVLLIGDPGIAKSQLLRYVVKLSPRAIYTSGQSSTAAGLTATAVKDEFGDGRWTLEAGALVLADMGVAAVDEMDKMEKGDRSALHEAMEQQSISVAKAGITATLKSRCALLGAANPKYGRFDMYGDISDQINMPPSLLSRFDLIFIMTDQPEQKRDLAIAEHILKAHSTGELIAQHKKTPIPGVTAGIHCSAAETGYAGYRSHALPEIRCICKAVLLPDTFCRSKGGACKLLPETQGDWPSPTSPSR